MVERLTEKRNSQNTIPLKNAVCGLDMPYWALCNQDSVTDMYLAGDAADRLAAYEDTGLTPEEIAHAKDLIAAEKDGRCVVLPCKVDAIYWEMLGDAPAVSRFDGTCTIDADMNLFYSIEGDDVNAKEIGKTVFLTRAEAEKALGKGAQS